MEKNKKISAWIYPGLTIRINQTRDTGRIIPLVCQHFSISEEDMLQKTRLRTIKTARQAAYFWLWMFRVNGLKGIAARFNQDHSTVMHGAITMNNLIDTDSGIRMKMDAIRKALMVSNYDYSEYKSYLEGMYMKRMGCNNKDLYYSHPFLSREPIIAVQEPTQIVGNYPL